MTVAKDFWLLFFNENGQTYYLEQKPKFGPKFIESIHIVQDIGCTAGKRCFMRC